ncbi:MAG: alkaline phosphatase family protein [Chitinophagaceae bacterium]|nr:alkaline phosphatase family protein [Chitinophagaceae bacterium]
MNRTILFVLLLISSIGFAQQQTAEKLARPKLVVGIMVDQMRWDYLYRYYDRYQPNGLKRLLKDGFSCENTLIDYIPTVTGIGHSAVYTGSVPAIHGITANDFYIKATGQYINCVGDSTVQTVGSPSKAGKASPRNLLATTITDELKLATNFRAKVIGIALKDRGAILPAGHLADAAYWFDDASGNMITSDYYMNELPKWVREFNARKLPEKYLKQDWNTLYDLSSYTQSLPDDNPYEAKFSGQKTPTFPVRTSEMIEKDFNVLRETPFGNTYTFDMAKAAVENEKLGQGALTDFLTLSFSATDGVGHQFGINAVEVEDTYLRLDKDMASFLGFLDNKIGKGNYTVFLTADHGAGHNSRLLMDRKVPAGIWREVELMNEMNALLEKKYHAAKLVVRFRASQIYFNHPLILKNNLDLDSIKNDCIRFLKPVPGVAFVVDMERAGEATLPEEIKTRIINGYNPYRSGVIQVILQPGWQGLTLGTGHSAWNPYDAHIPAVFMGWGIKQGRTVRETHITDIAPTIASLLRVQMPNGSIGKAIPEALK